MGTVLSKLVKEAHVRNENVLKTGIPLFLRTNMVIKSIANIHT
jgi:hypothetical protein